jgi:hypothetical protein
VPSRVSLGVSAVESVADQRACVRGEVWLGPVVAGDVFTAASDGITETAINLRVADIAEPPDAQEPGRVARVVVVLTGEGSDSVRPGIVLLGETADM